VKCGIVLDSTSGPDGAVVVVTGSARDQFPRSAFLAQSVNRWNVEGAPRTLACLRCGNAFQSQTKANRMCSDCRSVAGKLYEAIVALTGSAQREHDDDGISTSTRIATDGGA